MQDYPPQQGYPPQGYPPQPQYSYPPQPQHEYPPPSGYAPPPQSGYPQEYPPQYGYPPPQTGYPPQYGYPPQGYTQGPQKKALLVGINYLGTEAQLAGSHDNVDSIYNYLTRNGYAPENILVLTDKPEYQNLNRGLDDINRSLASHGGYYDDGQERGAKDKKKNKGGKDKKDKKGKSGKDKKDKKGKSGKGKHSPQKLVNDSTALGQYINKFAPYGISLFNHFTTPGSAGQGLFGQAMGAVGALTSAHSGGGGHGGGGGGLGGMLGHMGSMGTALNVATHLLPIKNNILGGLKWLTNSSRSGDNLFFHFVGHGAQSSSRSGDSETANECIMPLDYYSTGMITDEELHDTLISQVPEGARLISLMDCSNSGIGMDLPYCAEARGFNSGKGGLKANRKTKGKKENRFKQSKGTTICISSVRESDEWGGHSSYSGQYSGQLTHAFLDVMNRNPYGISYEDLAWGMREAAGTSRGSYSQTPALAFNDNVDLTQVFTV